jgi:hypothetical protein
VRRSHAQPRCRQRALHGQREHQDKQQKAAKARHGEKRSTAGRAKRNTALRHGGRQRSSRGHRAAAGPHLVFT